MILRPTKYVGLEDDSVGVGRAAAEGALTFGGAASPKRCPDTNRAVCGGRLEYLIKVQGNKNCTVEFLDVFVRQVSQIFQEPCSHHEGSHLLDFDHGIQCESADTLGYLHVTHVGFFDICPIGCGDGYDDRAVLVDCVSAYDNDGASATLLVSLNRIEPGAEHVASCRNRKNGDKLLLINSLAALPSRSEQIHFRSAQFHPGMPGLFSWI